jgi:PE-PPE domain-containing protein
MRALIRSLGLLLLGFAAATVMGLSSALVSTVALAATTALVMGGTQHSLNVDPGRPEIPDTQQFVDDYAAGANGRYIHCDAIDCTVVGAVTPEEFYPTVGTISFNQSVARGQQNLDNCLKGLDCTYTRTSPQSGTVTAPFAPDTDYLFGYSQSATIVTLQKREMAAHPNDYPDTVFFDVIGNPNRPNGGFVSRGLDGFTIPFLDVTLSGPTPTDTPYLTDDTARQYDGLVDSPVNPLNFLSDVNALMGAALIHGDYFGPTVGQPILQDEYGDTTYYLIPTPTLPLLIPVEQIPTVGPFVAAVFDAPTRVLVEAGYNRTKSPGEPTTWDYFYTPNPVALATNFLVAIPTGLDDAISQAAGDPNLRPFQTDEPGPYGVGGPPVTMSPTTNEQNMQLTAVADHTDTDVQRQSETKQTPDTDADMMTNEDNRKTDSPAARSPRPKIRNPIGVDRPRLSDLASAIKHVFTKPGKQDATDDDSKPQDATAKTSDSDDKAA